MAKACPFAILGAIMRCGNCDAEIPEKSLYCDKCGTAVEAYEAKKSVDGEAQNEPGGNDRDERGERDEGAEGGEQDGLLELPAIHTSASWVTVNPPSLPVAPKLERIIIVGIAIIGVAVAVLMLLGCARFVLSLLN